MAKFIDEKAYSRGYLVGEAGCPFDKLQQVNPYSEESNKLGYDSWMCGFHEGHDDYLFEQQTDRYSSPSEDVVFMLLSLIAVMVCGVLVYKGVEYFFG